MTQAQDLVDEVSALLGAPATLEDRHFALLAAAAHPGAVDPVRLQTILARGSAPEVRAHFESFGIGQAQGPVRVPAAGGRSERLCLPARFRGVVQGYIWVIATEDGRLPTPGDPRLEEAMRLADAAGDLLAQRSRQRREATRLFHELVHAPAGAADVSARVLSGHSGIGRSRPVVVVVAGRPEGEDIGPEHLQGRSAALRGSVLAADGAGCALVVESGRLETALAAVQEIVPDAVIGVGDEVPDLAHARESWVQAGQAYAVARLAPDSGPVARWARLGVLRLLGGGAASEVADASATPAVRALLASGRPELVETARVYLDAAGSVAATATALGLHRQSVYHRLEQVGRITGLDLRDGRARLELHLGLTLGA
ncbi:MAG: helix-turn-helix domain-containing protein [Micrococcales bacterium]|nr:helix-turn-helix domain-containing protein [Micrococcales bacterium]